MTTQKARIRRLCSFTEPTMEAPLARPARHTTGFPFGDTANVEWNYLHTWLLERYP